MSLAPIVFVLVALLSSASFLSVSQAAADGTLPELQASAPALLSTGEVTPPALGPLDELGFPPVFEVSRATLQTQVISGLLYRRVPLAFTGLKIPAGQTGVGFVAQPVNGAGFQERAWVRTITVSFVQRSTYPTDSNIGTFIIADNAPVGDYLICVYRSGTVGGALTCPSGRFAIRFGV